MDAGPLHGENAAPLTGAGPRAGATATIRWRVPLPQAQRRHATVTTRPAQLRLGRTGVSDSSCRRENARARMLTTKLRPRFFGAHRDPKPYRTAGVAARSRAGGATG